MSLRFLEVSTLSFVARSALRPELLLTTAAAILGAVVLYGMFGFGGDGSWSSMLGGFVAITLSLLWLMLGMVAVAHQIHARMSHQDPMPNTWDGFRFAIQRVRSLIVLPAWGVGLFLAVMVAEVVVVWLANIPGIGIIWLALLSLPLLIFNTGVAIILMLSVFSIAAYVTVFDSELGQMRGQLRQIMKNNLLDLAVYNLGGVLLTLILAALVLSPLWLGAQLSLSMIDFAAADAWLKLLQADGFWGSLAHFIALIMLGLLLAAVCAIPLVIITHITLLVYINAKAEVITVPASTPEESAQGN